MNAQPTDLTAILPDFAYWQLSHDLTGGLPPPTPDTPEQRSIRDHSAVAQVVAMQPANSMEVQVAVRAVQAAFHAMDAHRSTTDPSITPERAAKCLAQAALMDRQADSAVRLLLRMQAARLRIEANHKALDRSQRLEHITATLMTQALHAPPLPPAHGRFISPYDLISQNHANEIPMRQPAPTPTDADDVPPIDAPALRETTAHRPGTPAAGDPEPAPAHNPQPCISKIHPESQNHQTETPERRPAPPEDLTPPATPREAKPRWRLVRPDPFDPERPYSTDYYHPDQSPPLLDRRGRALNPTGLSSTG